MIGGVVALQGCATVAAMLGWLLVDSILIISLVILAWAHVAYRQQVLWAASQNEANARWALQGVMFGREEWPEVGGWALGPRAITAWLRMLRAHNCGNVVELGPGVSTLMTGLALPNLSKYGLEHDRVYLERLERMVASYGVENVVLIEAPLVGYADSVDWYSNEAIAQLPERVDALVVDGPPNWDGGNRRARARTLIEEKVIKGGIILVDDTHRSSEQRMVRKWIVEDLCELLEDHGDFMLLMKR